MWYHVIVKSIALELVSLALSPILHLINYITLDQFL